MKNSLITLLPVRACVVFILFLMACKEIKKPETPGDAPVAGPSAGTINGKYCVLSCTREAFLALDSFGNNGNGNRGRGVIFFKNLIKGDTMTMNGWTFNPTVDSGFKPTPNLILNIQPDSKATFQSGSYISDFLLSKQDFNDLRKTLRDNPLQKFIVFIPGYIPGDSSSIRYGIVPMPSPLPPVFDAGSFTTTLYLNPIPPGGGRTLTK